MFAIAIAPTRRAVAPENSALRLVCRATVTADRRSALKLIL
ncbi:Hypothetical protein ETEE_1199 [Edwardsiella anguillarum ET080813]|uniref:Uncharacterized protein n=1 Tax=Edwardsiella anguillarum ET080813 TaxID=667120 RepID=A0A076LLT9_9GAMM|nr:Hypothetical protein ETEE_1199 [Edwardsiella anguillarum ET080813]